MSVRAKFKVESVTELEAGHQVKLRAVTSTSPENASFFKWTPNGECTMGIVSAEVVAHFKPGAEIYVDFTPAG